ncbi:kinase-like protein [Lactarius sanguifluus]|nr:kinase-like protein [Lactarius sanguifluus]
MISPNTLSLLKESRHPNVVLYLGLSRAPEPDGRIFIISEFIENDLKGENLLHTANGRLKITDFGFARIAARNQEESRRLTFCCTDAYMSPEILLGYEFDLPNQYFLPRYNSPQAREPRLSARVHPACYRLHCRGTCYAAYHPCYSGTSPRHRSRSLGAARRRRGTHWEYQIHDRQSTSSCSPRIPSFGEGIGKGIRTSSTQEPHLSEEESDDELSDAVSRLENTGSGDSQQPLLAPESSYSNYSTSVIRGHSPQPTYSTISPLSSVITVRASPVTSNPPPNRPLPAEPERHSAISLASYYTASSEDASSIAGATEGGSSLAPALVHRFTLVKPGTIFTKRSRPASPSGSSSSTPGGGGGGWSALDFFFASGLLPGGGGGAKCDICAKRLGRKAALECDDCGLRAHIKCGEVAPRDCALRASSTSILTRVSSAPQPAQVKANKSKSPSPFSHR